MKINARFLTVMTAFLIGFGTTALAGEKAKNEELAQQVKDVMRQFKDRDSSLEKTLDEAHGYVIFPKIVKGGLIFGGAGGIGEVYEKGTLVGRAKLSQGTFGAQIGGQVFSEIILFKEEPALSRFKESRMEMSAQVGAVAAAEGASANADYANGIAVITLPQGGLMAEASVGGQKFKYTPLKKKD